MPNDATRGGDEPFLTVSDAFFIESWGALVVVPGPAVSEFSGPANFEVELWRPDGSSRIAQLSVTYTFLVPTPTNPQWTCLLRGVEKSEVPIGTEVWIKHAIQQRLFDAHPSIAHQDERPLLAEPASSIDRYRPKPRRSVCVLRFVLWRNALPRHIFPQPI